MNVKPGYDIVLNHTTMSNIALYKNDLFARKQMPGKYLGDMLNKRSINSIDKISDADIKGNGADWNDQELRLLGDLSVAMNVEIYDNGVWQTSDPSFRTHVPAMKGTLLFMPGPLLKSNNMDTTPDLKEISDGGRIDQNKYNQLIDRRLSPLLYYANENAKQNNVLALVTIPGIGCGAFAGDFRGTVGKHLNQALQYILSKHAQNFNNIALIFYDPYDECSNQDYGFHNVKYRVRPASKGTYKPQLSNPRSFEEHGDNFSTCHLFKVVAWDHCSFPGNDYFAGGRHTDDGVSAAATNSMEIITGIKGSYNGRQYMPPAGKSNWNQVVNENGITLRVKDNVKVLSTNKVLIDLMDSD